MSGKYIVAFHNHSAYLNFQEQIEQYAKDVNENGGSVSTHYNSTIKGFVATIPDSYLEKLKSLQGDDIDYIEPDSIVTTQ